MVGRIGPAASAAVPVLIDAARDKDVEVQSAAIVALGRIGPVAAPAVPALVALAEKDDPLERLESITALGRIGPAAAAAVPRLIDLAKRGDADVRTASIRALGRIGPAATPSIPMLMDRLKDMASFEPEAVMALTRIDPKSRDAIESLVEKQMLEVSRSPRATRAVVIVAAALEKDCPQLESAVNDLIDSVENRLTIDRQDDRLEWLEAVREDLEFLSDLGHGAKSRVPRLRKLQRDAPPLIQRWIADSVRAATE